MAAMKRMAAAMFPRAISFQIQNLIVNHGPVRNDDTCGKTSQHLIAQRRIVGGDEAGFGKFPWQSSPGASSHTLGEYHLNSGAEPLPPVQVGVSEIHLHPYFGFTQE